MNLPILSSMIKKDVKSFQCSSDSKQSKDTVYEHQDFNCKKTMFNDADAGALFSILTADIIGKSSSFKK